MTASARRALYDDRVRRRLCVDCGAGLQEADGRRCVEHAQAVLEAARRYRATAKGKAAGRAWWRAWYQRDPDAARAYRREQWMRRKVEGQCQDCRAPCDGETGRCAAHREVHNARRRAA